MLKLMIIGNLTADPTSRSANTQNGPKTVVDVTVAVNNRRTNQATFVRVSAWEKLGEVLMKYTAKGDRVCVVSDNVQARAYTASTGEARASLECTANEIELLGGRRSDADESPDPAGTNAADYNGASAAQGSRYTGPASTPQQTSMDSAMQAARDAARGFQAVDDGSLPF